MIKYKNLTFDYIAVPAIVSMTLIASIVANDKLIAIFASVCGLIYTIYAGKGFVVCYIFGIVSTICYVYLSFENSLWASLLLHAGYFLPMEIVGLFLWRKNLNQNTHTIKKTSLNLKQQKIICTTILTFCILGAVLLEYLKDNFPILDSTSTILSIAGMYLTVKRCIEQWIIWTVVNILSIILWLKIALNGGQTVSVLLIYVVYFFLGIYFYFEWRKEIKSSSK